MRAKKKANPKKRIVVAEPWHYERVDGDPTLRQIADVLDALGMRAEIKLKPKRPWWRRLRVSST